MIFMWPPLHIFLYRFYDADDCTQRLPNGIISQLNHTPHTQKTCRPTLHTTRKLPSINPHLICTHIYSLRSGNIVINTTSARTTHSLYHTTHRSVAIIYTIYIYIIPSYCSRTSNNSSRLMAPKDLNSASSVSSERPSLSARHISTTDTKQQTIIQNYTHKKSNQKMQKEEKIPFNYDDDFVLYDDEIERREDGEKRESEQS